MNDSRGLCSVARNAVPTATSRDPTQPRWMTRYAFLAPKRKPKRTGSARDKRDVKFQHRNRVMLMLYTLTFVSIMIYKCKTVYSSYSKLYIGPIPYETVPTI